MIKAKTDFYDHSHKQGVNKVYKEKHTTLTIKHVGGSLQVWSMSYSSTGNLVKTGAKMRCLYSENIEGKRAFISLEAAHGMHLDMSTRQ